MSGAEAFAILGLVGCAIAIAAVVLDWRERRKWRTYTLDFGDLPIGQDAPPTHNPA